MITKLFEVRDRQTFMPVIATMCKPANRAEHYLLSRCGYGKVQEDQQKYILLAKLDGGEIGAIHYDPFSWDNRTMKVAHRHIIDNFDKLESGDVIDVEFIVGESPLPKVSEAVS